MALRELNKVNEVIRVGPNSIGLMSYKKRNRHQTSLSLCTSTEERPCKDILKRHLSASLEERPR